MVARNSGNSERDNPSSTDKCIIGYEDQFPGKSAVAGSISVKAEGGGQKWH